MNELDSIEVDVSLTFGELLRASLLLSGWIIWLYCFVFAWGVLLVWFNESTPLLGIVLICIGLGGLVWLAIKTQKNHTRALKFAPVTHFHLSPEAFEASCPKVSTRIIWTTFYRIRETGEAFLFCLGPRKAILIPRRCLADETQIQALRNLVRAQCGEKAKLR